MSTSEQLSKAVHKVTDAAVNITRSAESVCEMIRRTAVKRGLGDTLTDHDALNVWSNVERLEHDAQSALSGLADVKQILNSVISEERYRQILEHNADVTATKNRMPA